MEIRRDAVIRKKHISSKVVWDKDSIKDYVVANPRDIRRSQVNKILRGLEKAENWEATIWVNMKDKLYRIIDGAHRKMAAELYFNKYPERKIEVSLGVFDNLTDAEEKAEYTRLNIAVAETINDFVQKRWKDIPITALLLVKKGFPCDVSYKWRDNVIEFRQLVGGYLIRDKVPFSGGYAKGKEDFINAVKELGHKDVAIMNAFLQDYLVCFGPPSRANIHYKPGVYYAMFKIWYDNMTKFNPAMMRNRFRKLFMHPIVQKYTEFGVNRSLAGICRDDLLRLLNAGGRKTNLFIKSDLELQWEKSRQVSDQQQQILPVVTA